jgi:SAM-dependent methyltransferase
MAPLSRLFRRAKTGDWPPVPPEEMIPGVGGGGAVRFYEIGHEFAAYFKDIGRLKPNERVLDAGCGCGRMAIPLTDYLNAEGSYEGFDVVPSYIEWCQQQITTKFPRFGFHHVDVWNSMYNAEGKLKADSFRFPFDDNDFDFAFLTSVFTHMFRADIAHYLDELHRVMRPGQRVFATYFVMNDESLRLLEAGKSELAFMPVEGDYWIINEEVPEAAVGYKEAELLALHKEHGFKELNGGFQHGGWSGRDKFLSYQDIVVLEKV